MMFEQEYRKLMVQGEYPTDIDKKFSRTLVSIPLLLVFVLFILSIVGCNISAAWVLSPIWIPLVLLGLVIIFKLII